MHTDGEVDVRGTYTVVAVSALLNMLTPELTHGVAEYVIASQVCACISIYVILYSYICIYTCTYI